MLMCFSWEGNRKLSSTRKFKVPCCCLFQSKESMARPYLSTILVRPALRFQTLFLMSKAKNVGDISCKSTQSG